MRSEVETTLRRLLGLISLAGGIALGAALAEAGNIFDPATAKRLLDDIYASGGSRDPEDAYVAFRGREPEPDALLRRRGLLETPEAA